MIIDYSTFGNSTKYLLDKLTMHNAGNVTPGVVSGFKLQALHDIDNSAGEFTINLSALNTNVLADGNYDTSASFLALDNNVLVPAPGNTAPTSLAYDEYPLSAVNSIYVDYTGHTVHVNLLETFDYDTGSNQYIIPSNNIQLLNFYNNSNVVYAFNINDSFDLTQMTNAVTFFTVWIGVIYSARYTDLQYHFVVDSFDAQPIIINNDNANTSIFTDARQFYDIKKQLLITSPIQIDLSCKYPIYINDVVTSMDIRETITIDDQLYINTSVIHPLFETLLINKVYEAIMYKMLYLNRKTTSSSPIANTVIYYPLGVIMAPPSYSLNSPYKAATNDITNYVDVHAHGIVGDTNSYKMWENSLALNLSPSGSSPYVYNGYYYLPIVEESLALTVLHDLSTEWFEFSTVSDQFASILNLVY